MRMKKSLLIGIGLSLMTCKELYAQEPQTTIKGFVVPACVYEGDTLPALSIPNVLSFKRVHFATERQRKQYYKLVYNVKKTLPIARQVHRIVIETYEYIQTLPTEKERQQHLKRVEKDLKQRYTPVMKKLTFSQGKLLIKLINRETDSSSYELVKSFMGSFKAFFYQGFAAMFGASLKKEYHPEDEDQLIENIIIQIDNGQL
jgi:hypothetical protein